MGGVLENWCVQVQDTYDGPADTDQAARIDPVARRGPRPCQLDARRVVERLLTAFDGSGSRRALDRPTSSYRTCDLEQLVTRPSTLPR